MLKGLSQEKAELQKKKADMFIDEALRMLHKHFRRWATAELLPAALLSEAPLAVPVARVMLGFHPIIPYSCFVPKFFSSAHDRLFDISNFASFLLEKSFDNAAYFPKDIEAAEALVFKSIDLRNSAAPGLPIKDYVLQTYLPLASQTQFVEAGVKEAKLVSPTGRHEPLLSAYAIIRSHLILSGSAVSNLTAPKRVVQLLTSAEDHIAKQNRTRATLGMEKYDTSFAEVRSSLNQNHFKGKRLNALNDRVQEKANNNRKENQLQKSHGVDTTAKAMNMMYYSAVTKIGGFEDALKAELKYRGIEYEIEATFKSKKDLLAKHEASRVINDKGSQQDINTSKKAFKPLSELMRSMIK